MADPGFWKGEGHLSDCPLPQCSHSHLNDLVSDRLFTEPELRLMDRAEPGLSLVWEKLLFGASYIDCESACS